MKNYIYIYASKFYLRAYIMISREICFFYFINKVINDEREKILKENIK